MRLERIWISSLYIIGIIYIYFLKIMIQSPMRDLQNTKKNLQCCLNFFLIQIRFHNKFFPIILCLHKHSQRDRKNILDFTNYIFFS